MLYWLYHVYAHSVPAHRGRSRVNRVLDRMVRARRKPFPWRMRDGTYVSVRPDEVLRRYGVGATCFHDRQWEPHVRAMIDRILRPGDVAIDAGANIGVFTVAMGRGVGPTGRVHAFEPAAATFDQLRATVAANRLANVDCHRLAVADAPGELELFVPTDVSANASAFERRPTGGVTRERVPVTTLDDFAAANNLRGVRLLKVDVEGCELSVLRGAAQLIARDRPHVIVELNPETSTLAGWSPADLIAFVNQLGGYRINMIVNDGKNAVLPIDQISLEAGAYLDLHLEPT